MRGHTTFSNLCNASQWFLWGAPHLLGIPPDKAMYAGLILTIFGARKRDAVETLIYKLGAEHGMGKGMSEYKQRCPSSIFRLSKPLLSTVSGSLTNFRAVFNAAGPVLFGRAYAIGKARDWGGFAFVVASATVVLAECCFRM